MERGITENQRTYIDMLIKHGHEEPESYPKITSKNATLFIEKAVEEGKKRAELFRTLPPEEGKKRPELLSAYQALSLGTSLLLKSSKYQEKSPEEKQKFLKEIKEVVARDLEQGKHLKSVQTVKTVAQEPVKETQNDLKASPQSPKAAIEQKNKKR